MFGCSRSKISVGCLLALVGAVSLCGALWSCGTAPTAFLVSGPGGAGNVPPTLEFTEPTTDLTRGQGDPFLIRWIDTDPDDNASISFSLINIDTNQGILLVTGLAENEPGAPDSHTVGTALIPTGSYTLRGTIDDGVNAAVNVVAVTGDANLREILVRIVGEGEGQQTEPPTVAVTAPAFDLSVTQDDVLTVAVQPTLFGGDGVPFDRDSDIELIILLDFDQIPTNDDPANPPAPGDIDPISPNPSDIIVLDRTIITEGVADPQEFRIRIDLSTVPPRPTGEPYYIRATAFDGTNPSVHQYAVGTISVVQLASGDIDLFDVGRSISGAKFYGHNPGANLGSSMTNVLDFDLDGVADFVLVAQFGNPRNAGLVGEAYLVYGQDGTRFGGVISANSISETIDGAIFEAPPVRTIEGWIRGEALSDGIADVNYIPDVTGDGRPEIIFGLPRVVGAFDTIDFDPSDEDVTTGDDTVQMEILYRQGRVTVQTGDGAPVPVSTVYSGVDEVTISSAQPNTNFGSSASLSWQDAGDGQREWGLIKFRDVLNHIPDSASDIDFTTITASIRLRVFDTGGQGAVNQLLTDFDEQTRYSTFAVGGGDPQPDIDYVDTGGPIGNVDGGTATIVEVDVSDLVRQMFDGLLFGFDNEIRLIIVPNANEGADRTSVRSSEFTSVDTDRPTLRIGYTRGGIQGSLGCFPDGLVNNQTDDTQTDAFDVQWYAGGMAVVVNSQNRDNDGLINIDRLDSTVVALELVGQRGGFPLGPDDVDRAGGNINVRADNQSTPSDDMGNDPQEGGRISGFRFVAGWFDFVDHSLLGQPAREGKFAQTVSSIGDVDNDGVGEIIVSAPYNERYREDLFTTYGFQSTHWSSTPFTGSIVVFPGANYNDPFWRDDNGQEGTSTIPALDQWQWPPFGRCQTPSQGRHSSTPADAFEVFAEDVDDRLGGAQSAGDFNQDGLDDILCGAYMNDRPGLTDAGAAYVLYTRNVLADFQLSNADDPIMRTPMLRIRGAKRGDQVGWKLATGRDVNGDRIDDVFIASPRTDYGGVIRSTCGGDFNGDGVLDATDLSVSTFNTCERDFGDELFSDDPCKVFDYDNDSDIDDEDRCIFCCLSDDCEPAGDCVHGRSGSCCTNLVDNGFVGIVFGGRFLDGDRDITQLATSDLPGAVFYGGKAGDRAGMDISTAGDFNQDGFGDLLISVPGEVRRDTAGRERLGVTYLVFGGTHLQNTTWNLSDLTRGVGSPELPGIVFLSPYVKGRPNEAAPTVVGFLGDINSDGFGDIGIGNPKADFIDLTFPQGPDAGSDPAAGRRPDTGDVYVIYGNNFGTNRGAP